MHIEWLCVTVATPAWFLFGISFHIDDKL